VRLALLEFVDVASIPASSKGKKQMNARVVFRGFTSTRPFGVELEVNDKVSKPEIKKVITAEDPLHNVKVTEWAKTIAGDGWHVKRDGTCGHEIASYKMSGFQDLQNVGNVADALRRRGCQVDEKCGLHVHADLSDFNTTRLGVMLGYWLKIEPIILQALPDHRRDNKHCRMMRTKFSIDKRTIDAPDDLYYLMEPSELGDHNNEDKRVTLNFVPYVIHRNDPSFKKCTAEIRMPEGTLLKADVQNWVRLYLHFVDTCKMRQWPGSLKTAGLKETLQILDLLGGETTFYLLGKDLYETRKWFLRRICEHTDQPDLYEEAVTMLNEMTQPIETHPRQTRNFAVNAAIGAI
jgi:hypothetical protein